MWDERSKPQRRGYLKRSTKPIKRSWIKRKPKRDRKFKDGRIRLASKSSLRQQTHDAAHGLCQHVLPNGKVCGKNAPLDGPWYRRGHLAHKSHGAGRRTDTSDGVYWSCGDCHRQFHGGGKPCPKKPTIQNIVWDHVNEWWHCSGCKQNWLRNAISRCQCAITPLSGSAGGGKMERIAGVDWGFEKPAIVLRTSERVIRMVGDDDLLAIERDNRTRITTMKELLGE